MAYNSTIITKKKQLGCGHFDFNFSKNRCKQCATIESTKTRAEKAAKETQPNPKTRPKGWFQLEDEVEDMLIKEEKGGGELQRWFEDRRKEMTGKCVNCSGKSCKDDDKYWKFSIAHLMPKAYVKSVATHPDNWLELCHFGNGCHSLMDNKMIDLIDMNCFDTIIQKFVKIYPHIAQEEKRRIPSILLEYLKTEL